MRTPKTSTRETEEEEEDDDEKDDVEGEDDEHGLHSQSQMKTIAGLLKSPDMLVSKKCAPRT